MKHHLAGGLDAGHHRSEAEAGRLMVDDRLAEDDPILRVRHGRLARGARDADCLGRDPDAAALQIRQRDPVAIAFLAEAVRGRHARTLERDLAGIGRALAELRLDPRHDIARGRGRHDERGDPVRAFPRAGAREDQRNVRILASRDELLRAVEHVVVTVTQRPGRQRAGVGSAMRLGQRERAQHLAGGHRSQEALLLIVAAEPRDRHATDRIVATHHGGRRCIARRNLLERQRGRHRVDVGAAPLGRHVHPHQAQSAHLAQFLAREMGLAIPACRMWGEPFAGEPAGHVADHRLLFVQDHRSSLQ